MLYIEWKASASYNLQDASPHLQGMEEKAKIYVLPHSTY
jgi:hypothetical protein